MKFTYHHGRSFVQVMDPNQKTNVLITQLYVLDSERRQGVARKLMSEICADADKAGVYLWLTADPGDPTTLDWLRRFYESMGFGSVREGDPTMIRPPVKVSTHATEPCYDRVNTGQQAQEAK